MAVALAWIVAALTLQVATSYGRPSRKPAQEPDPSFAVSVQLGGKTYVNKVCLTCVSLA